LLITTLEVVVFGVKVPGPVHKPVELDGKIPVKVTGVAVEQIVLVVAETDVVKTPLVILTLLVAKQLGFVALVTVHAKVLKPGCKPVTKVLLDDAVTKTGLPLAVTIDQTPL
jgi:hypothetical protein